MNYLDNVLILAYSEQKLFGQTTIHAGQPCMKGATDASGIH